MEIKRAYSRQEKGGIRFIWGKNEKEVAPLQVTVNAVEEAEKNKGDFWALRAVLTAKRAF